jgi:ArsR family transcriptional regulator
MNPITEDQIIKIAGMFKALGDPTRLRIFEFLRRCPPSSLLSIDEKGEVRPLEGPTAGEVCCQITGANQITSRISFHLKELRQAGLITMKRRGKNMICRINQEAVALLARYLEEQEKGGRNHECG